MQNCIADIRLQQRRGRKVVYNKAKSNNAGKQQTFKIAIVKTKFINKVQSLLKIYRSFQT